MSGIEVGMVLEGYEFIEPIGKGGSASVYKVRSQKFDRLFVAKVTHLQNSDVERAWQAFDCEIQALLLLDHPSIIKLYGHFRYKDNFVLILEYCPGGSLEDYIKEKGAMTGPTLVQTVKEVCSALNFAWGQGVHHHDIKPANILFDDKGQAVLADFGISIRTKSGGDDADYVGAASEVSDFRCSPICAAPEILNRVPFDPLKSDIWATGVTFLWTAKGSNPWMSNNYDDMVMMIRRGQYKIPPAMDKMVAKFVARMLAVNPAERVFPTDEELGELQGQPMVPGLQGIGTGNKVEAMPCHSFRVPASGRFKTSSGKTSARPGTPGGKRLPGRGNRDGARAQAQEQEQEEVAAPAPAPVPSRGRGRGNALPKPGRSNGPLGDVVFKDNGE